MIAFAQFHYSILGLLVVLPVAAAASTCSDATCGDVGPMLLVLNSSNKKVVVDEETSHEASSPEPLALPAATSHVSTNRLLAVAASEYDSDGDDGIGARDTFDLEFTDDEAQSAAIFQKYAKEKGYAESNDVSFAPAVWNDAPEIRGSHNCYMYALNDISPWSGARCQQTRSLLNQGRIIAKKKDAPKICKRYFHKPGYFFQNIVNGRNKTDVWFREETTCRLMLPMLAADSPAAVWRNDQNTTLTETDACPSSFYMAALVIDPKAGFHFYRRDHACEDDPSKLCWSHKPGIMLATDKDASGKKIHSVVNADRNYGALNYKETCGFFCVPQNSAARTHSDARKV